MKPKKCLGTMQGLRSFWSQLLMTFALLRANKGRQQLSAKIQDSVKAQLLTWTQFFSIYDEERKFARLKNLMTTFRARIRLWKLGAALSFNSICLDRVVNIPWATYYGQLALHTPFPVYQIYPSHFQLELVLQELLTMKKINEIIENENMELPVA